MSWYTHGDALGIEEGNRSFTVALSNLLQKLDFDKIDPQALNNRFTTDDPVIDWWTIGDYVKDLIIDEVNDDEGGWPSTSNAIVRFRRMDPTVGGIVDHYCLLADHQAMSIVDSLDGVIKSSTTYGVNTGYAVYSHNVTIPVKQPEKVQYEIEKDTKGVHTVTIEENNLWGAAAAMRVKVEELIEFNHIKDPRSIKPGMKLRVPTRKYVEKYPVRYEILDRPAQMHIATEAGAKKVRFGRASAWVDLQDTGRVYHLNENLYIVAIAHVTLKDENTTAAYYMDSIALGQYATTGKVQFTIGFNHSHLKPGHIDQEQVKLSQKLQPMIERAMKELEERKEPLIAIVEEEVPEVEEATPLFTEPTYKDTIEPIEEGQAITYRALEDVLVHEIERRSAAHTLKRGQEVDLTFTVVKDGVLYGLPLGFEKFKFWFAIPMDKVEEAYPIGPTLAQKVAYGRPLSSRERLWVIMAKAGSQGTRLKSWFEKKVR